MRETDTQGMRKLLDEFNSAPKRLSENKIIKLVEERGVWPAPYKQQIEGLVNKIEKWFYNNGAQQDQIIIPDTDFKFIKEIETLRGIVTFEKRKNIDNTNWGAGKSTFYRDRNGVTITPDGKLALATIEVTAMFDENGHLFKRTLFNNLCHEIHHLLSYREPLLNRQKMGDVSPQPDTQRGQFGHTNNMDVVIDQLNTMYPDINNKGFIEEIIYRLLNPYETNALVSGVFGDLQGFNSTRENFRNDLKKTQAYIIYSTLSANYERVIDTLSYEDITNLYELLNRYGMTVNTNTKTPSNYRYLLKRRIKHLLSDFFKRIGAAASLYYDTVEEEQKLNETHDRTEFSIDGDRGNNNEIYKQ